MSLMPTLAWTSVDRLFDLLQNGEQMDVLFGSPGWATAIVGVVTRYDNQLDWMMYLQDTDRFEDWGSEPPTLFARKPDLPDEGEIPAVSDGLPVDRMQEAFTAGWRTNAVTPSDETPASYLDGCEAADWHAYCAQGIDVWLAGLNSGEDEDDGVSAAARLERFLRIGRQILWTDYGVPAIANEQTRHALETLAEIMFFEAMTATAQLGDTSSSLKHPRHPSVFETLRAERDESDRRAGAAQREVETLREERRKRDRWMTERKKEVGLSESDSFDAAWQHLRDLAKPQTEEASST